MAQLQAFVAWCKEAMECLRAMQGRSHANGDDSELEEQLMVNNSLVDNEWGGRDVTVKVSWRKVWEGLKKRELKPISWLETEDRELCTVRWASAFLCGVSDKWCGNFYFGSSPSGDALSSFYSSEMVVCRRFLRQVTINLEGEGCTAMLDFDEQQQEAGADTGQIAAYGYNESIRFPVLKFQSYSFESESLRSSYPALEANNRERAVVGLADSVIMAKRLGVEKLSMMRRYFERYRLPTNGIWAKAIRLFLQQFRRTLKVDSPLSLMFFSMDNVPLPYQLQMVSLWDECRNWRILQASAHKDILVQLYLKHVRQECLFEMEPLPTNVFEYCRRLALTDSSNYGFLGVSMETVRTFLGEWVLSAPDAVDWEPSIPGTIFEFSTSFRFTLGDKRRIIWECQRGLQSELAKKSTAHANMSSSAELIMMFILSMPLLRVEEEIVEEENGNVSIEAGAISVGESSDTTVSRAHSSVNVFVMGYRVYSRVAPQDISIVVRRNMETRRASLSLRHNGADGLFRWQDWVNAWMGCMKGVHGGRKDKYLFRRVDLRKPLVELSPLLWVKQSRFDSGNEDKLVETGIVRVWMGWPAFDSRICKFEVDQWLRACNIDMDNIELDQKGGNRKVDLEIIRAVKMIEKVR